MINTADNFGQQIPCKLCGLDFENQSHLIQCIVLKIRCPELLELNSEMNTIIFGQNMNQINQFLMTYEKVLRIRNNVLDGKP